MDKLIEDNYKDFDVEMALEMNALVHQECKDVPHDIGIKLAQIAAKYHQQMGMACHC